MADRVYTQEEIILGEGKDEFNVTIRPNPIARQRRFMAQWDKNAQEAEKLQKEYRAKEEAAKEAKTEFTEEFKIDTWDGYISLCGIALEKQLEGHVDELYTPKRTLTKEYREFLEEVLDEDTMFRIIEVCGGINLRQMWEAVSQTPEAEEALDGLN